MWTAGLLGGLYADTYWLATLHGGTGVDSAESVTVAPSGNVYISGNAIGAGGSYDYDIQLAKYTTDGALQWQKRLGGIDYEYTSGIGLDSSENVYVTGTSPASGSYRMCLAKYNSSGVLQWQKTLGVAGTAVSAYSSSTDQLGNTYIVGPVSVSGYNVAQVAKYDSSGVLQWQRTLSEASSSLNPQSVSIDISGNVYLTGSRSPSGASTTCFIAKYTSSGVLQWQRTLSGSSSTYSNSIKTDSAGNVYIAGYLSVAGMPNIQLAKYNSSGVIQWQKTLSGVGYSNGESIDVDALGNSYVAGTYGYSGVDYIQLVKYNTAGELQWQRTLGNGSYTLAKSVAVDSRGALYAVGRTSINSSARHLICKLPTNGLLTGTYVLDGSSLIYATSSLTDSSVSFTDNSSSFVDNISTLTDAASSFTDVTSTLTSTLKIVS